MIMWFKKSNNGTRTDKTKSISIRFILRHWRLLHWKNNGAKKGVDKCYDFNVYILGIMFSYTNWDYSN